jgi:hypothetical protein
VHRLLAQIVEAKETGRRHGRSALVRASFRLRVKVKGAAVGALGAPDGVVGREGTLRRDCLLPWAPRRGDLVVLDPAESARFLAPRGRERLVPGGTDAPRVTGADTDGDGWPEDVFTNEFAAGAVQPHRGARLQSLVGRDGRDRFAQPMAHIMAGQYVLLGGAEVFLPETGMPGEVWKAPFARTVSAEAAEVGYSRKLDSPRGATLTQTVRMEPGLPAVLVLATATYAGRPKSDKPDEGGSAKDGRGRRKDTVELGLGFRMSTPVLGGVESRNLFEIPSGGDLARLRYHRPAHGRRWRWRDWKDEFFRLAPGFIVSRNEREGNALVVLFGGGPASVAIVRSDFEGPEVMLRGPRRTVAKGGRVSLGAAFLPADAVAASGTSLLAVTLGRRRGGDVSAAVLLRTSRRAGAPVAVVSGRRGRGRAVRLSERKIPGAGSVHAATVTLRAADLPAEFSASVGRERLACAVEG